jgi:hypothetical protein
MKHFKKPRTQTGQTKQVSVVALLGPKPIKLKRLIEGCIQKVKETEVGSLFDPFPVSRIHATIVGLERLSGSDELFNANIWFDMKQKRVMNFDSLLRLIRESFPMTIRIGGVSRSFGQFESWGEKPYVRSFQLLCPAGDFTLVGWPHEKGDFRNRNLWKLRDRFDRECNIRHKYSKYEDNDFFMRIGRAKGNLCSRVTESHELRRELENLEWQIREFLSENCVDVSVTPDNIYVVTYQEKASHIEVIDSVKVSENLLDSALVRGLVTTSGR